MRCPKPRPSGYGLWWTEPRCGDATDRRVFRWVHLLIEKHDKEVSSDLYAAIFFLLVKKYGPKLRHYPVRINDIMPYVDWTYANIGRLSRLTRRVILHDGETPVGEIDWRFPKAEDARSIYAKAVEIIDLNGPLLSLQPWEARPASPARDVNGRLIRVPLGPGRGDVGTHLAMYSDSTGEEPEWVL